MAIYNLPVLFCSVFLLYFLTFFLDFKFFLNDRLTIKTVATNQDFFRFGQGIDIAKTVPCLHGQLLWLTPRYAISKPYLFLHNS
ncbi:MAG: hypothetical protein HEQ20_16595 [Aphanizomenon flos-aquae KM1D3_PB]|uniref:hypothetical protein n=1 Tax=Aphanizomenon flos-aquae TaxID=1176 RepID=UPI001269D52B|nr:hypothetical protein [Aphanizomenon flos-aquae]QSV72059.1 MAG: hypothetical protein HEQ20_16595 [Aphanizomenon flos-aquae KM1D3_PB]